MITTEIAAAAIPIAEEFDRRGLRIIAKPGTPLAALVNLTAVAYSVPKGAILSPEELNAPYEPVPEQIQAESSVPSVIDNTESQHCQELDSIVTELSDAVSAHTSFAKNVVKPLIKELAGSISAAIAGYPETSTFNPTIVISNLPEPMLNPSIQDAIAEYHENTYAPVTTYMELPSMEGKDILELLVIGSKDVDADITVWTQRLGDDFFKSVYDVVFTASGINGTASFETLANSVAGNDSMLAVYLIGRRLLDTPPEGTVYSLPEYRKLIGERLEQSAVRLCHGYEQYALDEKTELLIKTYDKNTVVVNAPVYSKWLANGGNNAILFGNVLADRPDKFLPGMLDKSADNISNWERQNRFQTMTLANRRIADLKSTVCHKAEELIANNLAVCFGEIVKDDTLSFLSPVVASVTEKINDYVSNLSDAEFKDVWAVSTTIVAGLIFYYTDAYKILMGIEAACKENDGIDIDEAALLSLIEYVVDYTADQLAVVEL